VAARDHETLLKKSFDCYDEDFKLDAFHFYQTRIVARENAILFFGETVPHHLDPLSAPQHLFKVSENDMKCRSAAQASSVGQ
jgi:hypothetical protein